MKLGEFSRKFSVPSSTVHYYINNGLLLPNNTKAQYDFTEADEEDMRRIIKLKEQQFSLKEIQAYFTLLRHSNFIEPETIDECLLLLNRKKQEISEHITLLQTALKDIDAEIEGLINEHALKTEKTGVPVITLPLLVCPYCKKRLHIKNAEINGDYIISGELHCNHGDGDFSEYVAHIVDGVIETGNIYTGSSDRPDLKRGLYRDMSPHCSMHLAKCSQFLEEQISDYNLHGKVILESCINGFFFLYKHLNLIPEDCVCIITDKYPEMLKMYRSLIEMLGYRLNILYIAEVDTKYPLMEGIVDLYVSYFGENEYQLYHQNCFFYDARRFFKKDAKIFGTLLSYEVSSVSRRNLRNKYPESGTRCFQARLLQEDYKKYGYQMEMTEIGFLTEPETKQYAFSCMEQGEPLHFLSFIAYLHEINK